MRGFFISVEGGDGSGKSTQLENIKQFLREKNIDFIFTREPGGTRISEKIRDIILDPENKEMADITEAFLYAASRAQHVAEKIKPALESGVTVVCDRFVDSSIVYQGIGRGLGDVVKEINTPAIAGYMPDVTFFLDISPDEAMKRIGERKLDRLELAGLELQRKTYEGYKKLVTEDNTGRMHAIDATGTPDEVWQKIKKVLEEKCL